MESLRRKCLRIAQMDAFATQKDSFDDSSDVVVASAFMVTPPTASRSSPTGQLFLSKQCKRSYHVSEPHAIS